MAFVGKFLLALGTLAVLASCDRTQPVGDAEVLVYKTPACDCCTKWAEHLRDSGFSVMTEEIADLTQLKRRHGVQKGIASCHTAIVEGYVIEGHVPGEVIRRLLEERPSVVGLAVPGMPMGSPGMEGPFTEPYEILSFDREGRTEVYARR